MSVSIAVRALPWKVEGRAMSFVFWLNVLQVLSSSRLGCDVFVRVDQHRSWGRFFLPVSVLPMVTSLTRTIFCFNTRLEGVAVGESILPHHVM